MIQIIVEKETCQALMRGEAERCIAEAVLAVSRMYVNLKHETPELGEIFKEAVKSGLPWREVAPEMSVEIRIPDTGRRGN